MSRVQVQCIRIIINIVGAITRPTHLICWKEAIAVPFGQRELVRKLGKWWWSAHDARTFEQSVFSKSHTTKTFIKEPYLTLFGRKRARVEACSRFRGNGQIHTQNDYRNPSGACVPRVNYVCSRIVHNKAYIVTILLYLVLFFTAVT